MARLRDIRMMRAREKFPVLHPAAPTSGSHDTACWRTPRPPTAPIIRLTSKRKTSGGSLPFRMAEGFLQSSTCTRPELDVVDVVTRLGDSDLGRR